MFRTRLVSSVALLFAVSTLSAFQAKPADLTGTWTGTFTPEGSDPGTAHLALRQKGETITGTAGPNANQQSEIAKGRIATVKNVTTVAFEVTQPSGLVMKFDLKLVEGRLKGTVIGEQPDGGKRTAALDVGRAK
jgi:hypothetical protein